MQIKFIPILNLKQDGATSTLLILDQIYILLDCGINENLELDKYLELMEYLQQVDLVLLSHSSFEYSGALPFIQQYFNSKPDIYSTYPVQRMSTYNVYDLILNRVIGLQQETNCFEVYKRIYYCYDKIKDIKFQQKKQVHIKGVDLVIGPQNIGNTLGACAWSIQNCVKHILYMISYNHQNENHLDGLNLEVLSKQKVDILLTNSNYICKKFKHEQDLEKALEENIAQQLSKQGRVLIFSHSSERILEIVLVLLNLQKKNPELAQIPIDYYNNLKNFFEITKSQTEFMSLAISELLHSGFSNPYEEKNLQNFNVITEFKPEFFQNYGKFEKRILLTNFNSLFYGPLQEIFSEFLQSPQDMIIQLDRNKRENSIFNNEEFITPFQLKSQKEISRAEAEKTFNLEFDNDEKIFKNINILFQQEEDPQFIEQENDQTTNLPQDNQTNIETMTQNTQAQFQLYSSKEKMIQEHNEILFTFSDFPQFYFQEKKYVPSEYGHLIDESEIRNADLLNEYGLISENVKTLNPVDVREVMRKNYSYYEDYSILRKIRKQQLTVQKLAKIIDIDFSGVSDAFSMAQIISILKPDNIITINGNQSDIVFFKKMLEIKQLNQSIYNIDQNNQVQLELDNQNLEIDYLNASMNFENLPCNVSGSLNIVCDSKQKKISTKKLNLAFQPLDEDQKITIFGEISLEKLMDYFSSNNIDCTFELGCLNFNNGIYLKKEKNHILLEGVFIKDYFKIRNLLYNFYNHL